MPRLDLTARAALARLRASALGHRPLRDAAVETIVLHPADEAETSCAISLPAEIERARATMPDSSLEEQHRWVKAGTLPHGPTTSYRLKNAVIFHDAIFAGRTYEKFGTRNKWMVDGRSAHVGSAQLCEAGGAYYFGHWLCDNLATELLAGQRGLRPVSLKPRWMHDAGYRQLSSLHAEHAATLFCDDLWIVDDRGYNAGRRQRLLELRGRIRSRQAGGQKGEGQRCIYMGRGTTGSKRDLTNDHAVREELARRGFLIIEPETLTPDEIIGVLTKADLVVSVEGSAICHALVTLPASAGILMIQPPDRFNIFNKIIGDFAGLRTGYVVADPAPGGFSLDIDRLLRTLDLMLPR